MLLRSTLQTLMYFLNFFMNNCAEHLLLHIIFMNELPFPQLCCIEIFAIHLSHVLIFFFYIKEDEGIDFNRTQNCMLMKLSQNQPNKPILVVVFF